MSSDKALRGSCHCGRNQYIIEIPADAVTEARVLFETDTSHRTTSATPLSAFLRVPLTWYHSQTFPLYPDESRSSIRRIYSSPSEQHAMRHFCGFCGTPISYFTEEPRSEAEYIQLTLGSLLTQDLRDLEELGLIPSEDEDDAMDIESAAPAPGAELQLSGRDFTNLPWFDNLIQGSRLGNVHTSRGVKHSRDGTVRVEWEITEWTDDSNDDGDGDGPEQAAIGKRKRADTDQEGTGVAKSDAF
ncbi:hypothetical protein BX600DRAFT_470693 [Xylariales sp. PMI_506]|nr:hypothetical protein BX600DRAFT_470693 [Xylariales sp. PMI_506]